jgi:hypothetical protein
VSCDLGVPARTLVLGERRVGIDHRGLIDVRSVPRECESHRMVRKVYPAECVSEGHVVVGNALVVIDHIRLSLLGT